MSWAVASDRATSELTVSAMAKISCSSSPKTGTALTLAPLAGWLGETLCLCFRTRPRTKFVRGARDVAGRWVEVAGDRRKLAGDRRKLTGDRRKLAFMTRWSF